MLVWAYYKINVYIEYSERCVCMFSMNVSECVYNDAVCVCESVHVFVRANMAWEYLDV